MDDHPQANQPKTAALLTWFLLAVACCVFSIICALTILGGKRSAELEADQNAQNISQIVSQDIARTFEIYSLSIQGVVDGLHEPAIARLSGRARQLALFDSAANAPYLKALRIIDENGNVVEDSWSLTPQKRSVANEDYFTVQKNSPDVGFYVSRPFRDRVDGEWLVALSKRISKPDGSFGGVVVGAIETGYFQSILYRLTLNPDSVVSLYYTDGELITRLPFKLGDIGKNFGHEGLFLHYPTEFTGRFEATSQVSGIDRRFTFTKIANLPLIVSVGFSKAVMYAPWRRRMLVLGGLLAALLLALGGMLALFVHMWESRKRMIALLRESEERHRILADHATDALVLKDPRGRRRFATGAYYLLLGRSQAEMGGKGLYDFLDEASRKEYWDSFHSLRPERPRITFCVRYEKAKSEWKWVQITFTGVFHRGRKPIEIVTALRDVTLERAAEEALIAAALLDAMTGIPNRRAFDERLQDEAARSIAARSDLALLIIDVDKFKDYNDCLGHLSGDEILKTVARQIAMSIRQPGDLPARYGGEEFAVILPSTDAADAAVLAEAIRVCVESLALLHPTNAKITVSVGAASMRLESADDVKTLIERADAALYAAKRNGRNRSEVFEPETERAPARLIA